MRTWYGASLVALLVLGGTPVQAEGGGAQSFVFSAICNNIQGLRFDEANGDIQRNTDGFGPGTSWSYTWDSRSPEATLILQNGRLAGAQPRSERATAVVTGGGTVTFVSILSGAVWLHTISARTKRLAVTQHTQHLAIADASGVPTPAAAGLSTKHLFGTCAVTIDGR
jgi:hypothetical protein